MKILCAATVLGIAGLTMACGTAGAAERNPGCAGFARYAAARPVAGEIVSEQTDTLGISHVIVKDGQTGCRVFALAPQTSACTQGRHYAGFGHLLSAYKGEEYDATLSLNRDKGLCS